MSHQEQSGTPAGNTNEEPKKVLYNPDTDLEFIRSDIEIHHEESESMKRIRAFLHQQSKRRL